MEYEIRFYFPKSEKNNLISKLETISELNKSERLYEKTTQYNSAVPENDFYSKKINGRYRIRITRGKKEAKCMLSWKRRLPDTIQGNINKEEEVECKIFPEDYEKYIYILENINKMLRVESYERYRTNFYNNFVEVSVDEYPFGIALEIEAKVDNNPEKIIEEYMNKLGLDYSQSYRLSWDDKYEELCKEQGKKRVFDVLFESEEMPEI